MPPAGDGFYYFHMNMLIDDFEDGVFDIQVNGEQTCTGAGDASNFDVYATATCSLTTFVRQGKFCRTCSMY